MPVSAFLLVCFDAVLIGGNFYIYIFLKKKDLCADSSVASGSNFDQNWFVFLV